MFMENICVHVKYRIYSLKPQRKIISNKVGAKALDINCLFLCSEHGNLVSQNLHPLLCLFQLDQFFKLPWEASVFCEAPAASDLTCHRIYFILFLW